MARITKAELEAQVADMAAQIEALNTQLADADTLIGAQQYELERRTTLLAQTTRRRDEAEAQLAACNTPSRRVAYHMPAWQAERAAAMAAAKAAAMRMQRVVAVAA